jgi:hypothetical protein
MKKLLEANVAYGSRRISQVFRDFCELSALAIRNSVDMNGWDEREAQYLRVIGDYTPEEAERFAHILAKLALEFEAGFSDALGHLYMSLDLGSDHLGQFFTPYEVSSLMAQMTLEDYTDKLAAVRLEGREFITVNEPTCGSGGMIIALADALRGAGVNYQQAMHVTAQDIELTSVHMTYVQLSLLNIPAVVIHGNTLTLEQRDAWYTPAHILGGWDSRLENRARPGTIPATEPAEASVTSIRPPDIDIKGAA